METEKKNHNQRKKLPSTQYLHHASWVKICYLVFLYQLHTEPHGCSTTANPKTPKPSCHTYNFQKYLFQDTLKANRFCSSTQSLEHSQLNPIQNHQRAQAQ